MPDCIYLSHYINNETPVYGGQASITIERERDMKRGDNANTTFLSFGNHTGTHIDFPFHFSPEGHTSSDYPADYFVFRNPFLFVTEAEKGQLLSLHRELDRIPETTDILLIKTGFEAIRHEPEYWESNPGLDPQLAVILSERCPDLKVIGVDFISISSYQNREIGRKAHQYFLVQKHILLIEDMRLSDLQESPREVIVAPLLIEKSDGAPVTVIAWL